MIPIGKKYFLHSVFALTRAEDIWKGVEKVLYEEGRMLHFQKRGTSPILRAKQFERIITVKNIAGRLVLSCDGISFSPIIKERFGKEEIDAVLDYLAHSEDIDAKAVKLFRETGEISDTCRPCYASLKCEVIRRRLRVFIHLTIEGKAKRKFSKDGSPRQKYGTGAVGCDIGTQTIAYTSDKECGLKNLAERGEAITGSERKERILLRKLDRSRRAMNPDNFNDDGTEERIKEVGFLEELYGGEEKAFRTSEEELHKPPSRHQGGCEPPEKSWGCLHHRAEECEEAYGKGKGDHSQ